MEFERRVTPFYMAYPGPMIGREEDLALKDLEYLQQTYPHEVRKYQRRIAEILDKMDYEGSMIYDEYPDRYSLQYTTENIIRILQIEEGYSIERRHSMEEEHSVGKSHSMEEEEKSQGQLVAAEKREGLENLIQVLLCNEIFKRRHGGRRRLIKF